MKSELRSFVRGFGYAANGIWLAIRQERNFRFHLCAGSYVLLFAKSFCTLSGAEWAILWLCIGGVVALELMNSAVERAVAKPDQQHDAEAGAAKDLAAGAVLCFAAGTAVVAFALLLRAENLAAAAAYFAARPLAVVLLAASLAAAALFVFGFKSKG